MDYLTHLSSEPKQRETLNNKTESSRGVLGRGPPRFSTMPYSSLINWATSSFSPWQAKIRRGWATEGNRDHRLLRVSCANKSERTADHSGTSSVLPLYRRETRIQKDEVIFSQSHSYRQPGNLNSGV